MGLARGPVEEVHRTGVEDVESLWKRAAGGLRDFGGPAEAVQRGGLAPRCGVAFASQRGAATSVETDARAPTALWPANCSGRHCKCSGR